MKKAFLFLLLSSTLAFGQGANYPPDSDKDIAQGFGDGVLSNICAVADVGIPTTGTIEEVLATCTIPGGTFPAAFTGFEVFATYLGAANANAKTVQVRVDGLTGTSILDVTADTDSAETWELSGDLKVDGGGAAGILSGQGITTQGTGASTTERIRVTGLTFASDIDVVFTATTASASGDVELTSYMVRLMTGATGESGGHWDGGGFTAPALAPNGSDAAPAYSFVLDTDMGCYRSDPSNFFCSNKDADNGKSYFQLGEEFLLLSTATSAASTVYSEISCWQNADMECYVFATDGVNSSITTFANTGTTFSDPTFLPNGGLSAPAYSFTTDPESGMAYFVSGPLIQNQGSSTTDGRTWSVWQDGNFQVSQWYDAVPVTTSSIRMVDAGTDEPQFEARALTGTGNSFDFNATTVGVEPTFLFTLNDGGAGDVDVLKMTDNTWAMRATDGTFTGTFTYDTDAEDMVLTNTDGTDTATLTLDAFKAEMAATDGAVASNVSVLARSIDDTVNGTASRRIGGFIALVDNTLTDVVLFSFTTGHIGGTFKFGGGLVSGAAQRIEATYTYSCVNLSDTETCDIDLMAESNSVSSGTIVCTPSFDTTLTNSVMLEVLCDSSTNAATQFNWIADQLPGHNFTYQ